MDIYANVNADVDDEEEKAAAETNPSLEMMLDSLPEEGEHPLEASGIFDESIAFNQSTQGFAFDAGLTAEESLALNKLAIIYHFRTDDARPRRVQLAPVTRTRQKKHRLRD